MKIDSFQGIHNVASKRDIPDAAVQDAVNVDITNGGSFIARDGYLLSTSQSISTAYTTADNITYSVIGGHLYRVTIGAAQNLILIDLGVSTATSFADYQGYLFTNDGKQVYRDIVTDLIVPVPEQPNVVITGGNLPAGLYHVTATLTASNGLEGGCCQVVTVELTEEGDILLTNVEQSGFEIQQYQSSTDGSVLYNLDSGLPLMPVQMNNRPFPSDTDKIEYHDSKLYLTMPMGDYTEVLFSKPNHYHLYDLENDYFVIQGKVLDMKSTPLGLVLATDSAIYAYQDGAITQLADYGVVVGRSMVRLPNRQILIHSVRGVYEALPLKPLTEQNVSLPMGEVVNACLMYGNGINRYVGLHDGLGEAFNQF